MASSKKRARKKSKVPTRIYSYRCLPPVTESAIVEAQFRLAAEYRNALVEVEHWLTERLRLAQVDHPTIGTALLLHQDAQGGVDDAYDDLRAAKSGTADPDLTGPLERLDAAKDLRSQMLADLVEAKIGSKELSRLRKEAAQAEDELEAASAAADAAPTAVDLAREKARVARAACEECEAARPDDVALLAAYRAARGEAEKRRKAASADYRGRGLRHGAYRRVEEAVKQAVASTSKEEGAGEGKKKKRRARPIAFERYDGSGSIGHQLTDSGSGDPKEGGMLGMTIPELMSAADTRLRLGPPGALDAHPRAEVAACATWEDAARLGRNLRRHAARTWVDLRVGTHSDRSPIFARFPVTLHRLPPKGAVIKWAYVVRRRVGPRMEWRFQLTLESPTFDRPQEAMGEGACAVNVGWRRLVDDQGDVLGLRAAYVVDETGREREVRVPDYVTSRGAGKERRDKGNHRKRTFPLLGAVGKCDDLASIRDKSLERAQLSLSAWLAERGGVPAQWQIAEPAREDGSAPRPMADRLRGYSAWRAAWKLRRFVDAWKSRRVDGDDQIFDALTAWAKQDRHLETWQATMRDRLIARRRETWRVVAAELARTYATILVGQSKLPEIDGWEKKAPEDGDPAEGREQRRMSRIAAPGELIAEIEKAAHKTGARVARVDEALATQACSACGHDEPWDAAPSIAHTCGGCGRTWDQDANHCRNLLAREGIAGGGAPRPAEAPLDQDRPARRRQNFGSVVHAALAKAR